MHEIHDKKLTDTPDTVVPETEAPDILLINAAKSDRSNHHSPGDIHPFMSKNWKRMLNLTNMDCKVSYHKAYSAQFVSLMDRDAIGDVGSRDAHVIFKRSCVRHQRYSQPSLYEN